MTQEKPKTAKQHNAQITGESTFTPSEEISKSDGGLQELLEKHKEDFIKPGTFIIVPKYEQEITAIGVILRQLAALPPDAQERALSYAASWVDDQKKEEE